MGHAMGLEHGHDHEVMTPTLPLGIRRLPESEWTHREGAASQEDWLRLPQVERPKKNDLLDDFSGIPVLFETGQDYPWIE